VRRHFAPNNGIEDHDFLIGIAKTIMHLNLEYLHVIARKLEKRINLLIVDDFPLFRNALVELFSSPLFNTVLASSEREARRIIPGIPAWHAWLFDIAMENDESGLKLLADHQHFPYTIMLSGIRSMNVSSKAMQLGAYKVFDKEPALLSEMHAEVCALAALAYILKGTGTKYFPLFKILLNEEIDTTEAWAQAACVTKRQIERICSMHVNLPPRFIVPLFYTIRYLLQFNVTSLSPDRNDADSLNGCFVDPSIINHHVSIVHRNIDMIFDD
jgi:ActR/RegA family two-component response regulator